MITTRRLVTLQPRTVSISRADRPPPPGKTHLDLIWGKICLLREKEEGSRRRSDCSRASAAWFNLAADSVADHLCSSYFGRWVRVNAEEGETAGGTEGRKEDNLFTEMEEKGNVGSQITILQIFWRYIDTRQWNNQLNIEIRYKLRPSSDFTLLTVWCRDSLTYMWYQSLVIDSSADRKLIRNNFDRCLIGWANYPTKTLPITASRV